MAQTTDFYITQFDQLKTDPVKSTMWRVIVGENIVNAINGDMATPANGAMNTADIAIQVQSASIPEIGSIVKDLSYMGMKKWFPAGIKDISGDASFKALFLEDMQAYETFVKWNQLVVNGGVIGEVSDGSSDAFKGTRQTLSGLSKGKLLSHPAVRNEDLKVELYSFFDHRVIMDITYVNAMCTSVKSGISLGYGDPSFGNFDFTVKYDRFKVRWYAWGEGRQPTALEV